MASWLGAPGPVCDRDAVWRAALGPGRSVGCGGGPPTLSVSAASDRIRYRPASDRGAFQKNPGRSLLGRLPRRLHPAAALVCGGVAIWVTQQFDRTAAGSGASASAIERARRAVTAAIVAQWDWTPIWPAWGHWSLRSDSAQGLHQGLLHENGDIWATALWGPSVREGIRSRNPPRGVTRWRSRCGESSFSMVHATRRRGVALTLERIGGSEFRQPR